MYLKSTAPVVLVNNRHNHSLIFDGGTLCSVFMVLKMGFVIDVVLLAQKYKKNDVG